MTRICPPVFMFHGIWFIQINASNVMLDASTPRPRQAAHEATTEPQESTMDRNRKRLRKTPSSIIYLQLGADMIDQPSLRLDAGLGNRIKASLTPETSRPSRARSHRLSADPAPQARAEPTESQVYGKQEQQSDAIYPEKSESSFHHLIFW